MVVFKEGRSIGLIIPQLVEIALAVIDEPIGHPALGRIALGYSRNAVKRIIEVVDNRTVRILNPDEPVVFIVDIGGERGIPNPGAYCSSPLIVGEIVCSAAAGYAIEPAVGIVAIAQG